MNALYSTNFNFPGQKNKYTGKVREVYYLENDLIIIIATDRISAFDVVMPEPIPFKGQVLNQISNYMLLNTNEIVPNWLKTTPDPNVSIGLSCKPFKIEMVVRGYLAGHAAREYKKGKRLICGVEMEEGLVENDKFKSPIVTPATKSESGHDEDISRYEIINRGIVSETDYNIIEKYALQLFNKGTEIAKNKNLILVDTKYEFGKTTDGKIVLIDEIHTPDSSRYFYRKGYKDRQSKGLPQRQLSKEFVRQWLIENNFQGLKNQKPPMMTKVHINDISQRYIELYEQIIGEKFEKPSNQNITDRIRKNISLSLGL
ncbi:MAG: phosphoribosylaminoimidazolesuccinocarboxamide synthase [Flavobacteriaceae bacterium]|tara:strand:- start:81 stop:1025 length:945 start_codon:yes stop_codon:yes gene_type:complete